MGLGNLGIGQRLDPLHGCRLALRRAQFLDIQQFAARARLVDRIAHPQAEQAVPAGQVVIDEG